MISTDILHAGGFQIKFPNISRYTWIFAKIKESTSQNRHVFYNEEVIQDYQHILSGLHFIKFTLNTFPLTKTQTQVQTIPH